MKRIDIQLTTIPEQEASDLETLFSKQCFGEIDSNIAAWLLAKWPASDTVKIATNELEEPLNNKELVQAIGGMENITNGNLFTPAQIVYLVEQSMSDDDVLQRNGYQNLFFVSNQEASDVYLLGVVYDDSISKWVPYIYRLRNLYRAWSRGNRVFLHSS